MGQRILFGGGGSPHQGPLWGRNLPLDPQVIMGRKAGNLVEGIGSRREPTIARQPLRSAKQRSVEWSRASAARSYIPVLQAIPGTRFHPALATVR
jgi:hypothetical protein